jgi:O-antigen ligase
VDVYGFAHAHQTAISIGAQAGLLGLVIIVIMLAFSKRQAWSWWELATLAVVGVLSLFEDVAMVWQVGIVASIILAGNQIRE